ncbi:MAG TPA: hypothetical protein DCO77_11295 [Nitrospiraceae bacterium]|nr:hypothetical protein [Nitrospiraceae bacterium]
MRLFNNQRGVSIIAAIFIIVILGFMGVIFLTFIGIGSFTSINDVQASRALFVAEGGVEYILGNRTFPNYSMAGATMNLGAGTFTVSTPTYLTANIGAAAGTIPVQSTVGFPAAGRIAIDSELIDYAGTTAVSFTGATRGAGGSGAAAHAAGNAVFPVTTVTVNLNAVATTINVGSTTGFSIPGVIKINTEYLHCTSSTAITFTNCTRGYKGTTAAVHGVGSNVYQYVLTSAAVVGNARRSVRTMVGGGAGSSIAFSRRRNARGNNVNFLQWNHRVSGTERYLIVGISLRNNAGQTATNVTYAGTPLVPLGAVNNGANVRVELWGLVNPATGNNPVRVTLSAAARIIGGSLSFTGVDQGASIDAGPMFAVGNSNAPAVTVTTVTDNAWVIDTLAARMNVNAPAGPGQTRRWHRRTQGGGGGAHIRGAGSTEGPATPPGNVPMTWNLSAVRPWALGAVAIRPVPTGTTLVSWEEVVN